MLYFKMMLHLKRWERGAQGGEVRLQCGLNETHATSCRAHLGKLSNETTGESISRPWREPRECRAFEEQRTFLACPRLRVAAAPLKIQTLDILIFETLTNLAWWNEWRRRRGRASFPSPKCWLFHLKLFSQFFRLRQHHFSIHCLENFHFPWQLLPLWQTDREGESESPNLVQKAPQHRANDLTWKTSLKLFLE